MRFFKGQELGRPHLVLADFGGDIMLLPGHGIAQHFQCVLRFDDGVVFLVAERLDRPPRIDLLPPRFKGAAHRARLSSASTAPAYPPAPKQQSPTMPMSTTIFLLMEDGSISTWIFLELGEKPLVLPVTRSSKRAPMLIMTSQLYMASWLHRCHAFPACRGTDCPRRRIGAQPHQGIGDGIAGQPHQLGQQFRGFNSGIDDAAAGIEDWLFCPQHQVNRAPQSTGGRPSPAVDSGPHWLVRGRDSDRFGELHILRHIDQHRAGATGLGDVKGLMNIPASLSVSLQR
jgi:hypothetical protein